MVGAQADSPLILHSSPRLIIWSLPGVAAVFAAGAIASKTSRIRPQNSVLSVPSVPSVFRTTTCMTVGCVPVASPMGCRISVASRPRLLILPHLGRRGTLGTQKYGQFLFACIGHDGQGTRRSRQSPAGRLRGVVIDQIRCAPTSARISINGRRHCCAC
jgi:hypothetical protein